MKRYAITPSFGYTQCASRVYVAATNHATAVQAAKLVTGKVQGYVPTHWPVALVTHFPSNAQIVNAMA